MPASESGSYLLLLHLERPATLRIGALGVHALPAGYYLYAGSALGSGGLGARLGRHLRREKRRHWHIDYLLEAAEVVEVWVVRGGERRECDLARAALALPCASAPIPRFGASDCRCPAHLVHLPRRPRREEVGMGVEGYGAL
ncbi:MAG: GIY-YIG nuclease family protein [Chloroflexi bacterium]|nr:GIY-YIG nuclease family protein [Chloroflexota bacterium]